MATISGPKDTPYKDGHFFLRITFPRDYPFRHPAIKFNTKTYHLNIKEKGGTCHRNFCGAGRSDCGNHEWSPALTISKCLEMIYNMLKDPSPSGTGYWSKYGFIVENSGAYNLFKTNRKLYDKTAKEWTQKYAQ